MASSLIFLILGFIALVIGAELLIRGASSLAKMFHIPDYAIGATVVAFGTSAPELATSVYAAYSGNPDIAVANAVGSNFFNIALIIGIAALITPITLKRHVFEKDATHFVFSAIVLLIASANLFISRIEGVVLVALLLVYTVWLLHEREVRQEMDTDGIYPAYISVFLFLAGLGILVVGSRLAVRGAVDIATLFSVPQWIIGVTIVAAGTSLPELVTSVVAAFKKKPEIAVGNVIGSNIFNIYSVLGLSSLVGNLTVAKSALLFDIPVNLFLSIGLLFMIYDKKISRENGLVLIAVYVLLIISILQIH